MTSTYRILYVLKLVASWGLVIANLARGSFWNMDDTATIIALPAIKPGTQGYRSTWLEHCLDKGHFNVCQVLFLRLFEQITGNKTAHEMAGLRIVTLPERQSIIAEGKLPGMKDTDAPKYDRLRTIAKCAEELGLKPDMASLERQIVAYGAMIKCDGKKELASFSSSEDDDDSSSDASSSGSSGSRDNKRQKSPGSSQKSWRPTREGARAGATEGKRRSRSPLRRKVRLSGEPGS